MNSTSIDGHLRKRYHLAAVVDLLRRGDAVGRLSSSACDHLQKEVVVVLVRVGQGVQLLGGGGRFRAVSLQLFEEGGPLEVEVGEVEEFVEVSKRG